MKKLFLKPTIFWFFLFLIYIFSLLFGIYAVTAYPIQRQKNYFYDVAELIAQKYAAGQPDECRQMLSPNMRFFVFDSAGNCLLYEKPGNRASDAATELPLSKYARTVTEKGRLFRIALIDETESYLNNIVSITGIPVVEDDTSSDIVLLIKNMNDLPEAAEGYCVFFTILYWLSVCVIVSNLRKKQRLDEVQRNYIANVTHALKTPVASIKALSETLCDGVEPDPDRQKVYYGMILQEANRQDHMIRDILELSKLQSRSADFAKTRCNAAELLAPVLEKYGTLADCLGITLIPPDLPDTLPPLYSNAASIRQILELLLDNALKFTPEGGEIRLEIKQAKRHAVFCVRDDGPGIAADALPHVFERFFKGSHDFNASGSGLGLAIAKELARGLGERIWVKSTPGQGAAFYFTVRTK